LTNILIFLGPPGSGKGTQAEKISEKFEIAHISTGVMLRDHVDRETDLGIKAKSILDEGSLVPDDLVIQMLKDRLDLDDCQNGAILDGFPRTLPQALSLENDGEFIIKNVIFFDVNEEELVKRMLERGRSDDTEESIKVRLEVYLNETEPLVDFYSKKNLLTEINALGSIDDISSMISKSIKL
tara:strand:- start:89 stop:637 length:549 start_codon:yes stop_codon:yes gene_type:complete